MGTILNLINTETALTLIGTIVSIAWIAFKRLEFVRLRNSDRYIEAVQAFEVGVEKTYQAYVRQIKAAQKDGKLTSHERRVARGRAKDYALQYAHDYMRGVDVVDIVGGLDVLPVLISQLVRDAKGKKTSE